MRTCAREQFELRFDAKPKSLVRAPGRVEILGNHTDYNEGFVLTAAIDKFIFIAGRKIDDGKVTLYTQTLDDECTFSLDDLQKDKAHPWADYCKGVLHEIQKTGITLSGFQALITGDLPVGGGVSSSAALESATAMLMQSLFEFDLSKLDLAKLCQRAENDFVGMPCGILDQMSSVLGQKNKLLCIDCRSLAYNLLALPEPTPEIVICNTHIKHNLVQSEYKQRRQQCSDAAKQLSGILNRPVPFLRDVSFAEFLAVSDQLTSPEEMRAHHIISENERVCAGRDALQQNDVTALGLQMFASHESSKTHFQNSCIELDHLMDCASNHPACIGAKLSGGGFGGCTVNLIQHGEASSFCESIKKKYESRAGKKCSTMICHVADGASVVSSS